MKIKGTAIPASGHLKTLYFNKKLDKLLIAKILTYIMSKVTPDPHGDTIYGIAGFGVDTIIASLTIIQDSEGNVVIAYADYSTGEEVVTPIYTSADGFLLQELAVDKDIITERIGINPELNLGLKYLISSTPFEEYTLDDMFIDIKDSLKTKGIIDNLIPMMPILMPQAIISAKPAPVKMLSYGEINKLYVLDNINHDSASFDPIVVVNFTSDSGLPDAFLTMSSSYYKGYAAGLSTLALINLYGGADAVNKVTFLAADSQSDHTLISYTKDPGIPGENIINHINQLSSAEEHYIRWYYKQVDPKTFAPISQKILFEIKFFIEPVIKSGDPVNHWEVKLDMNRPVTMTSIADLMSAYTSIEMTEGQLAGFEWYSDLSFLID